MRVQVLLFALCAVAHGAPRSPRSLLGPSLGYGAPVPPAPPSPSYGAPAPPAPPAPPSPSYGAPAPPAPPAPPTQSYLAPEPPAPVEEYLPPNPEPPAPVEEYLPPNPEPPAPVEEYLPPNPEPPTPTGDYLPPTPTLFSAPSAPVSPPIIDSSFSVQEPDQSFKLAGSGESGEESVEESEESSEEFTRATDDVVDLSSAQTIAGTTLSDSKFISAVNEEVDSLSSDDRSSVAEAPKSSSHGYSYNAPTQTCQPGETLNSQGQCETVTETKAYYIYNVPEAPQQPLPGPQSVERRVHYNHLFVRVPTANQQVQNVYPSRDEQKTLVYVVRDPPKKTPVGPAPVPEPFKPEEPVVLYVTPGPQATYEEAQAGYEGSAEQEQPEPSHGYSYNPPSSD